MYLVLLALLLASADAVYFWKLGDFDQTCTAACAETACEVAGFLAAGTFNTMTNIATAAGSSCPGGKYGGPGTECTHGQEGAQNCDDGTWVHWALTTDAAFHQMGLWRGGESLTLSSSSGKDHPPPISQSPALATNSR